MHGEEDGTVFVAQARRLRDALEAVFAPVDSLFVTNGGHNLEDVGVGTPSHTIQEVKLLIAGFLDDNVRLLVLP